MRTEHAIACEETDATLKELEAKLVEAEAGEPTE